MEFIFKHTPIAQKRARIGRHGNFYNPQKPDIIKCRMDALSQIGGEEHLIDLESCMSIKMTAYTPYPKLFDSEAIKQNFHNPCPNRPDLDNYLKFYLDALHGVAYADDCMVTQIIAEKIFSPTPHVHIEASPHIGSFIDQMNHFEHQNVIMHERLQKIYEYAVKKIHVGNDKEAWKNIRQWAYEGVLDEIM